MTVSPKPVKGTEKARLRAKRRGIADGEREAKAEVRRRDPHCRWPHVTKQERLECSLQPNEVAHRQSKGAGGNKDGSRNVVENLITFCRAVHQGPGSLHGGRKRVEPLTTKGTRGPCVYFEKRGDLWLEVGRDDVTGDSW